MIHAIPKLIYELLGAMYSRLLCGQFLARFGEFYGLCVGCALHVFKIGLRLVNRRLRRSVVLCSLERDFQIRNARLCYSQTTSLLAYCSFDLFNGGGFKFEKLHCLSVCRRLSWRLCWRLGFATPNTQR